MNAVIVIQARLSSQRLPGKVLVDLGGRPMLAHLLERIEDGVPELPVCVATSDETDDEPIAEFCAARGTDVERGALHDVTHRLLCAARRFEAGAIVRICADSPFLDAVIVRRVVEAFEDGAVDLATNVHPRSFPRGQSIEVIRTDTLDRVHARMTDPLDREHVTRAFYAGRADAVIRNVAHSCDRSDAQMSVDTPEDLAAARHVVTALGPATRDLGWEEILEHVPRDLHEIAV